MGTRIKFAEWRKVGRLFVVRPPGWPKNTELSFTEKKDMIAWSHTANVILKDMNERRRYA